MPKQALILITGGGSGGHITPLLAVAKNLQQHNSNLKLLYLGSGNPLEKKLSQTAKIPYQAISTGKLRRYFDLQNLKDFFLFLKGIWQAYFLIKKHNPQLIFSKGGFVSLPVCLAGAMQKKTIILHESDIAMGLANRIISRIAKRICLTFDQIPLKDHYKYVVTGTPVRPFLLKGKVKLTLEKLQFKKEKPILLVMGGSQGAQFINNLIFKNLKELLKKYQIIHLCGQGKQKLIKEVGYLGFEYVEEELADFYAIASLIISRAGANSLAEISAIGKPSLLIPLPSAANNHQFKNAEFFSNQKAAIMLEESKLSDQIFLDKIDTILSNSDLQKEIQNNLQKLYNPKSTEQITNVILTELEKSRLSKA